MIKPVRNSSKLQSEELLWDMMKREIRGAEDTWWLKTGKQN